MKSAKNIIDKIFLDFTYKSGDKGKKNVASETRSFFYDNLLPKIDSLLVSRGEGRSLRIDSLTINVDNVSLEELSGRIIAALNDELDKYELDRSDARGIDGILADEVAGDLESLLFFLRSGAMPWYHDKNIYPDKLLIKLLMENKKETLEALAKLFLKNGTALERFVLQFTDRQLREVFLFFMTEYGHHFLLKEWYAYIVSKPRAHVINAFRFAAGRRNFTNETHFLEVFVSELVLPYLHADKLLIPQIVNALQGVLEETEDLATGEAKATSARAAFKVLDKKYSRKAASAASRTSTVSATAIDDAGDAPGKTTQQDEATEYETETSRTVDNAGIVILWPYLQMFFSNLGLVNDEQFISAAAQRKAVQVLHYLVTGNLQTPEHLMALNKILCGVDIVMPCPARLRLTKEEKQACETLLNAVIANWPPVKNTSINGFRQSFLQRNGVVKKDGNDWIIHVERNSIDILLDDMPWGLGVIKFPWNEYFVHVQW